MGALWHHGRKDSRGRSSGQTAIQTRSLTLQPSPHSQPPSKRKPPERTVRAVFFFQLSPFTSLLFSQYKADLVRAFSSQVLPQFSNHMMPVIDSVFSLEDIAKAHRRMEANKNMGKIVVNLML